MKEEALNGVVSRGRKGLRRAWRVEGEEGGG